MAEMIDTKRLTFDTENIGALLDAMSPEAIDELPFGVIKVAADRRVVLFSRAEAKQAAYHRSPLGLDFFLELAPCMNTPALLGALEEAARQGDLDIESEHVGDFSDRAAVLRLRIVSSSDGGTWHLHQRASARRGGAE